jgi:membrane-anchored glycerophosphoryl diester phosphodiesterase (GDPDase)
MVLLVFVLLAVAILLADWLEVAGDALLMLLIGLAIGMGLPAIAFLPLFVWHYVRCRSVRTAWKNSWRLSKSFFLGVMGGI